LALDDSLAAGGTVVNQIEDAPRRDLLELQPSPGQLMELKSPAVRRKTENPESR